MLGRTLLAVIVVLLCTPVFHIGALAQTITAVIQGTTVSGSVPCLNIAGSYPSSSNFDFVISNGTGGAAQVCVDDGSVDSLLLKNTVITASKANVSGTIELSYTYVPGPTAPASPPPTVRYETSVSGYFSPIVLNNEITLWGSIKNPTNDTIWQDITPAHYKKVTCVTLPNCGNINANSAVYFRDWNPFENDRIIRGKITFVLKNNTNKIVLTNPGLRVSSTEAGGGPDDCEPGIKEIKFWSSFSWTTDLFKCWGVTTWPGEKTATNPTHVKAYKFASATWDNLSEDMTRGHGEHLAALANLLHVLPGRRDEFFAVAQENYSSLLLHNERLSPESTLATLKDRWAGRLIMSSNR